MFLTDGPDAGSSKGFFEGSVGAQFATRSESPRKAAPKQATSPRASSGKGFFDSSVGAQFANRSESPKKAAPTSSTSGKQLLPLLLLHNQVMFGSLSKRS